MSSLGAARRNRPPRSSLPSESGSCPSSKPRRSAEDPKPRPRKPQPASTPRTSSRASQHKPKPKPRSDPASNGKAAQQEVDHIAEMEAAIGQSMATLTPSPLGNFQIHPSRVGGDFEVASITPTLNMRMSLEVRRWMWLQGLTAGYFQGVTGYLVGVD